MEDNILRSLYTINQLNTMLQYLEDVAGRRSEKELQGKVLNSEKSVPQIEVLPSPSIVRSISLLLDLEEASASDIEKIVEALKRIKEKCTVVHVTISKPYPEDLLGMIVQWCREIITPISFAEFVYDEDLLGGIMMRTSSRIFDFSFQTILEKEKEKVAAIISEELYAK